MALWSDWSRMIPQSSCDGICSTDALYDTGAFELTDKLGTSRKLINGGALTAKLLSWNTENTIRGHEHKPGI
jgi:hypothetical protein